MSYAIRYRRLSQRAFVDAETLAIDIEKREAADRLVDRLAESYPRHGLFLARTRWFLGATGLHLIWAEAQA